MKKLMVTFIIVMTALVSVQAQGFRRAGTNTQVKAMYKDELKQKLNLTETNAMNVDALQQDYMLKMRAIRISTTYTDAEKRDKIAELKVERNEKLKTMITEKQIAQVDEIYRRPNKKVYPPGQSTIEKEEAEKAKE